MKLAVMLGIGASFVIPSATGLAADDSLVTVVSSKADCHYVRTRLSDGSFSPEYYAFADGGRWTGTVRDRSLDNLPFMNVALAIAGPLKERNYMPTRDPKATNLLLVVYYGRTRTPEHMNDAVESVTAQNLQNASAKLSDAKNLNDHQIFNDSAAQYSGSPMMPCVKLSTASQPDITMAENEVSGALATAAAADRSRDQVNSRNASLLGYDAWWDSMDGLKGTPLEHRRQDMIDELEHDRYFVILMAYDFQAMWKQKKHNLLWETRFSVQQRGVEFDKQLMTMAKSASQYFGQDTRGLVRKDIPVGHVEIGDVQSLGPVAVK